MTDTITAISTSPTISAIAIVRMSGRLSLDIAKKITKKGDLSPRTATLSNLYNKKNQLIDEVIVLYFQSPRSFTGEDIVEFQCHGGVVVANLILQTIIDFGARIANPGEFSKRAFLNSKIDLIKAEAIAKMIETRSEEGVKLLARQLKGELKGYINEIRDELIEILAFVEVNIDYAEEDLPRDLAVQTKKKLTKISFQLRDTLESSKQRDGLMEGFKVSIIGKPNVGKSLLLNSLLNFNRAIVSEIAGTTRDTIEEEIKIGSHLIKIVDTAGIRESTDTIEKIGISRSVQAIEESEIVIALFDNSKSFDEQDEKILFLISQNSKQKKIIVALNKIDLKSQFDLEKLKDFDYLKISALNSSKELIEKLRYLLDNQTHTMDMVLISKRQIQAVQDTKNAIDESTILLDNGELELFSFHLDEAVRAISSITRNFDRGEILDKMFGNFCLGK